MAFLDDLKTLLGDDVAGGSYDALLGLIVAAVLEEADDFMGQRYQLATSVVQYHDGGKRTYYLGRANVSNLVAVVSGTLMVKETDGALAGGDYTLDPERGVVRFHSVLASGSRIVKFTFDAGYADANLPRSLRMKLMKQCAYEFRRRKDMGVEAVTFPDGTISKMTVLEWLPDVEEELVRGRRFVY